MSGPLQLTSSARVARESDCYRVTRAKQRQANNRRLLRRAGPESPEATSGEVDGHLQADCGICMHTQYASVNLPANHNCIPLTLEPHLTFVISQPFSYLEKLLVFLTLRFLHTSHFPSPSQIMPLSKPENSHVLSQFSLKGKTALVTGGSRGIGLEVVTGLAEAGANVAFTYSTTKDAEAIAAKIVKETGVIVKAFHGDVRNANAIKETINHIAEEFKGLDIVVANA
jgi:3-oxoacyl-ACP reductase-like protein